MQEHRLAPLTRVRDAARTDTGLRATVVGAYLVEQLRVDVVRDDIVRVKISRGGVFDESPTFAVREDLEQLDVDVEVAISEDEASLVTPAMTVTVGFAPFRIDVHRADGTVVSETAVNADGTAAGYATLNDAFTFSRRRAPGDNLFGLGEKTGPLNRAGQDYALWNVDVLNPTSSGEFTADRDASDPRADNMSTAFDPYYMSIPFVIHQDAATSHASASFYDNGYRGHFDFRRGDRTTVRFEGGQYTEYLFAGPSIAAILEGYTWLTGRMALPPRWALGYHQCRWHEYSQADIQRLARTLRERDFPCDSLWLDIEYMDGYRVFTWNRDLFPDVDGMLAELEENDFRMVTIVDPGVKAEHGYSVFDDALSNDVLCKTEGGDVYIGQVWPGDTAFPDFVTSKARLWWGSLNADHVRSGIAGIWNDMNEPATGDIDPMRMRFDGGTASHEKYHNQYALLMAMGTTQGLLDAVPENRTFVLSRAGSAGIQRYAANWTGDNVASWDHLRMSIAMVAGLGLSGQPFVGADIGGFAGNADAELFARWTQYAALTPFCRNHSMIGQRDQYPWSFGAAVEKVARDAVTLRYRLLPYLYSAFVQAAATGAPVQRALVYDFQYDRGAADVDDEFLLGEHVLVAPVLEAGATGRSVYLPTGTWYDWHTDEALPGEQHVVADAPLHRIPLYARAGAIVPMLPQAPSSTNGIHTETIELHVFVPDDGADAVTSLLQEDDGLTWAARDGAFVRTEFTVRRDGDQLRIDAVASGDGFSEFRRGVFEIVLHGATPRAAAGAAGELPVDGQRVSVAAAGEGFAVTVTV